MSYILRPTPTNKNLEKYPELTRSLLEARGITTLKEAEEFLQPDYTRDLHDPFLFKDMEVAVKRIFDAIINNEKILIFSDYDADGVPGGAILHDFFKKIGYENFSNYIPNRESEGFGLNTEAVDGFAEQGVKLVITVDCGVADLGEADTLANHGIDLIITDHHLPSEVLPKALAIIDAKLSGCEYPDKSLCGAGVAFKLVQGLINKYADLKKTSTDTDYLAKLDPYFSKISPGWEKWLLDLAGIATLSDMVPLLGENRAIAYFGLKVLRKSPRPGLLKLFRRLKIEPAKMMEEDITFSLTPRINAASRLGDPGEAFKLLTETDEVKADIVAEGLDKLNSERKGLVAALTKEVRKIINERYPNKEKRQVIVLGNPAWRPTLLGLVANSILADYTGAVFLWGREGGDCLKGSCRSNDFVGVDTLMKLAPIETFIDFGGHTASGGFTVSAETVHLLEGNLTLAYSQASTEVVVPPPTILDASLTASDVDNRLWTEIEKFSPFGVGNPKPLFYLPQIELLAVKIFGKEKNHLELILSDGKKKVSAIAFFSAPEDWINLSVGAKLNIVATLEKSNFRGMAEIRLRLVDVLPEGIN